VKKIISLAVGATAVSMAIFGTGVAAAEDYAGQTSSNASPRQVAAPGLLIGAAGMVWFSTLQPDCDYFTHLMPAMFRGRGTRIEFWADDTWCGPATSAIKTPESPRHY
jgi:hypothetical protein